MMTKQFLKKKKKHLNIFCLCKENREKKNVELCERTDYESEEYHTIIEEITNLNEHLSMLEVVILRLRLKNAVWIRFCS